VTPRGVSLNGKIRRSEWRHLAWVASDSEPGTDHEIKQNVDGRIGCDCMAYRFAKGANKTCKHIEGYFGRGRVADVATSNVESVTRIAVTHKGKTDTLVVRRAISFGGPI